MNVREYSRIAADRFVQQDPLEIAWAEGLDHRMTERRSVGL
jgi:hypothetical protein